MKFLFIILLNFLFLKGWAQNNESLFLAWPQVVIKTSQEAKFSYEGVVQARIEDVYKHVLTLVATNTLYVRMKKTPFYVGGGYTFAVLPASNASRQLHWFQSRLEYRPAFKKVYMLNRLMYDYIRYYDLTGHHFEAIDNRVRLMSQVTLPFSNKIRANISEEIFIRGRSSWFKENRAHLNIISNAGKKSAISLGYLFRWIGATDAINKTVYEHAVTIGYTYSL